MVLLITTMIVGITQVPNAVGERPYELVWANRTEDDHPPLVDFEDLTGWRTETIHAEAEFKRSREQQIWGQYVGKLTYRATGTDPQIRVLPPKPIPIEFPFDAVTCWIYGNNWAWIPDPGTPQVRVLVLFLDSRGREFHVELVRVRWKEWFLAHRRLSPEQIRNVQDGAQFVGFLILNGTNTEDRTIYFDNLAVFQEEFPELTFKPRPKRGIPMFPGQSVGTNTGPGKLPFPTRTETILPDNLADQSETSLRAVGDVFVFTYRGDDGTLEYRIKPETGTLGDITAQWVGRGGMIRPCVGGGVLLDDGDAVRPPENVEHLGTEKQGDAVRSRWRVSAGEVSTEVTYTYRLWGKSLVIDVIAPGGHVAEVRYGHAEGLTHPRLVTNPYYLYGSTRPAVVVAGEPDTPLFLTGHTDWCLSNGSLPWAENAVNEDGVFYNGGIRYIPRTDGVRNDCYERLFITISPRYEEMLPNIPNPKSPWKHVTGTRVWRAHGAGNRESDIQFWRRVHRYGMTEVVITDHETMWRDGGESFTFRTRAAPGKGGDEGAYHYARVLQDELGFVYGPYNNFTDFAPVNEYWSVDRVTRLPDNQLQHAWARCYAPKPAIAVEFCEKLAPQIQEKFHFSTAYCDVHTAVAPWDRVDFDYRVPGAGTFTAVFYAFGEIMLLQKAAWNGPVYSEGNRHYLYCGLTDGNYAQDQAYKPAINPWLVDFDLRKLHDLCCNFGMGNLGMFYGHGFRLSGDQAEMDKAIDRFLAATVAFGHTGFLVFEGGIHHALRSYYMLQQLHSRYALASVDSIRYADADGRLLDTSEAVATGVYRRSQIVTRYSDGSIIAVNGNPTERMHVIAFGRELDLPPNGYAGWTEDGEIDVLSSDPTGHRTDYAVTPAYIYVDGRGKFTRFAKAAGNGIGICRILDDGSYEVILHGDAECGFAVTANSAVALAEDRSMLGHAEIRTARGLTWVMPVKGAFSYLLRFDPDKAERSKPPELTCDRDEVVAGETVTIRGKETHRFQIPADAKAGDRIWAEFEGAWIDFTVVPLADAQVSVRGDTLQAEFISNLPDERQATFRAGHHERELTLKPGQMSCVCIDLGKPESESAEIITMTLNAGNARLSMERAMRIRRAFRPLVPLPNRWQVGIRLRGESERFNVGDTHAYVHEEQAICGGVAKDALTMHPPWQGGVGYVFALFPPVTLPAETRAAFRAEVGKRDGSDPGDGILYRIAVVDDSNNEHVVAEKWVKQHAWESIEADLSGFAGRRTRIKLIADVGPNDNSSGDWACVANARLESLSPEWVRTLEMNTERYRCEPGPYPISGLTIDLLRSATRGWLRYDGMGVSGTGEQYGSFAVLNGVELGMMTPAPGNETEGIWSENVGVPLTEEAINTLSLYNRFTLRNPRRDYFKVRRFWIELELPDGRRCSSQISSATFTQPPGWRYAEGITVPFGQDIEVDIWFR